MEAAGIQKFCTTNRYCAHAPGEPRSMGRYTARLPRTTRSKTNDPQCPYPTPRPIYESAVADNVLRKDSPAPRLLDLFIPPRHVQKPQPSHAVIQIPCPFAGAEFLATLRRKVIGTHPIDRGLWRIEMSARVNVPAAPWRAHNKIAGDLMQGGKLGHASSSSSALASWRTGASKPSVNQP
jgi:hypothetical protein